jgi:hypothetical protein
MVTFTTDEICRSFLVEDVTDNPAQLRIAFDLVAAGYAQLASTPLDPQEIREELCADRYHRHGLARTLLLTGANPNTGTVEPLGTLRIVLGYARTTTLGMPPLEAMALLTPEAGWQDFTFAGFDVDKVVEGGRTAVAPACRTGLAKAMGVPLRVLHTLYQEGFRLALHTYDKPQYWGILPSYVVTRVEALGITLIPTPRLTLNHQENAELFRKYDRYWLQSNPWFYKVLVPLS